MTLIFYVPIKVSKNRNEHYINTYQTPVLPLSTLPNSSRRFSTLPKDTHIQADLYVNSPYRGQGSHNRLDIGPQGEEMPKEIYT